MKIVFDNIIFSLQKAGGISVVCYELLKRIMNIDSLTIQLVEYNKIENIFRKKLIVPNNIVVCRRFFLIIRRYLNPIVLSKSKFIFHSSYYRTCSNKKAINITTVHDFTYEYYAKGLQKFIHIWQKHRAIKKSDIIICVSENTKKDLLMFVKGVNPGRIRIVYNGVSDSYCPIQTTFFPLPFKHDYVLYVGNRGGYKNFDIALRSVAKTDLNLVIVGNHLSKKESDFVESFLIRDRYVCLSKISDDELNILYNAAFCLLYPSAYEGFGIPVLEAQKAGCPVIAYNNSSIPEIIGSTPLLMNELSEESILDCFTLLKDPLVREKIIECGLENSKQYTWDRMCAELIDVYKQAWSINK
ncbi:MAG: glycosyltransferase family 1 protein [Bacteroidota bacterium]|nr:glycosyltransferase family 1 protein [Bacteroidota bacterium]